MSKAKSEIEVEIEAVATSSTTRQWLRAALLSALRQDCIEVADDSAQLAVLLRRRCDAILGRNKRSNGNEL
ncbi:hypothetical protein [Andreprevotia chitinilytica]|uniref:hypothetical protein n=1 Tax=Andreprevotia chitinilytica TaxID=396808 RepID=UPI0005584C38|nr:hypothetical protein [Andreprevotia chitinilytica]